MYHDLWEACYGETEAVRAEAILGAAHRLLAREGGEPTVVLAAAMLATVAPEHRNALLSKYVERDLHGEIHGILDQDPQNKNTAIVHDSILLASYHKGIWRKENESPQDSVLILEALLPKFRTESGKADAKHFLAERRAFARGDMPDGAEPLSSEDQSELLKDEEVKDAENKSENGAETHKASKYSQDTMKSESHASPSVSTPAAKAEGRVYHWADQTAQKIIAEKGNKSQYTVAAGITPSGVVHFGNFREIMTNDLVVKALEKLGKKVRFIYSWDDYDTFRKIPKNLPDQEALKEFLFRPTVDVPDPFGCGHENYADHFKAEITEDLPIVSVFPEFIHQNKKYRACEYAEDMKHVLKHREVIRDILNEFKTDEVSADWWPLAVYCEQCSRDRTTRVTGYDDAYVISYECTCGHKGSFDLRKKGIAKLPWRVDWPMRWHKEQVDFEPGGKDHSSQGGSYDSGKIISKRIWNYDAPTYIMYDFISFKGMKGKMSSSKGDVVTLRNVLTIYNPELVRFMFAGTRPDAEFQVSFDIDVFKVYEDFDTVERKYFGAEDAGTEKDVENAKRIYELSIIVPPAHLPVQPSFRHLTSYVQLAEGDLDKVVAMMAHEIKDDYDEARVRRRAQCAWNWVREYAPEQYKFTLATSEPYPAALDEPVRDALRALGNLLAGQNEEELLETFYQLCERHGIQNTEFFRGAYLTLVGKEKGPKLANIITQAGHERIAAVLRKL